MAASKSVERARKLLARARSDNPHEAALAAERARAYMDKHGITEGDVEAEERTTEVVEARADPFQRGLAAAIALLHGCALLFGTSNGAAAIRGTKRRVARATEVYRALSAAAEAEAARGGLVAGSPPEVRAAWRACFWFGFVESVTERVRAAKTEAPEPRPADAPPMIEQPAVSPPDGETVLSGTIRALERVRHTVSVDWLCSAARDSGRALAAQMDVSSPEEAKWRTSYPQLAARGA